MADIDQVHDEADLMKDRAKSAAGRVLGDAKLQAEGQAGEVADRLQAAYDRRREQISDQLSQVEGFAKSQPWAALAIAAASGLVLGRITAKRKVVYVSRVKPNEVR